MRNARQYRLAPARKDAAHDIDKVLRRARLVGEVGIDLAFNVEQYRLVGGALHKVKHFGERG